MTFTYTWKLTALKKTSENGINDAIIGTKWTVTGTDSDGFSGVFYGASPFNLNKIDPDNFIPYEELTEEIVLSWVQRDFEEENYKKHIDSQIQRQIDEQKAVVINIDETSFPWSTP